MNSEFFYDPASISIVNWGKIPKFQMAYYRNAILVNGSEGEWLFHKKSLDSDVDFYVGKNGEWQMTYTCNSSNLEEAAIDCVTFTYAANKTGTPW